MKNPLISIIIPAYNNATTIQVAINSILNQTYKNIEIIVVDDKSTDETREIIESIVQSNPGKVKIVDGFDDPYRFDKKLNRNINAGYSARNIGLSYAKGDIITFQDSDDASLLNRLEIQYELLDRYNAIHITTDCITFSEDLIGTHSDITNIEPKLNSIDIYDISQKNKGIIAKISPLLNRSIPFHYKRVRAINKLFFGGLEPYPGAGNSPMFRREVIEKVKFRKLTGRIWPSFMGRGADRDFNFQVAETFKNSYYFPIPLYLWRK